jgi:hypothetical protein
MELLIIILLIVALACFIAAAFGAVVARVNLVAFGLACWVLTVLIDKWPS